MSFRNRILLRLQAFLRRLPLLRARRGQTAAGRHDSRRAGPTAHATGARGERVAARALRRAGYRILGRNVRTPVAEIDLVCLHDGILVVVEVKTRGHGTPPTGRLGPDQQRRLRRAGRWLAARTDPPVRGVRYDLVTVVLGTQRPRVDIRRCSF